MLFSVEGMTCGHCVEQIGRALRALAPEAEIAADLAAGTVKVCAAVAPEAVIAALGAAGYPAAVRETPAEHGDGGGCCGRCH
jgi:copper chaperone